jgi:hypothetical protein
MITTRITVKRYNRTLRIRGYTEPEIQDIQKKVKEYLIGKFVFYRQVLDEERIPDWWLVQVGCYGDRSGWQSKFADYIN